MKAALYARVSTDGQTVDQQLSSLRQVAAARGYKYKEYVEDAISGTQWNRPALNKMLDDAKRGWIQVVICWDLSRLGRSVHMVATTVETLRLSGCDFTTVKENIDTTTPHGKFQFNVIAAFAQLERDMISMRTKEALKMKKEKGVRLGRPNLKLGFLPSVVETMAKDLSVRKMASRLKISPSSAARLKKVYQNREPKNALLIIEEPVPQSGEPHSDVFDTPNDVRSN